VYTKEEEKEWKIVANVEACAFYKFEKWET